MAVNLAMIRWLLTSSQESSNLVSDHDITQVLGTSYKFSRLSGPVDSCPDFAHERVQAGPSNGFDAVEDRDEHHDHDGVDGLNLTGKPLDTQEVSVHQFMVRLQDPRRARLIEEGPEHRDKGVDDGQSANRTEPFFR